MINFLLAAGVFFGLFIFFFISLRSGYQLGLWRKASDDKTHSLGIVKVAEGALFALFGLLIAFTFAGAYDRFENRKVKIIEEINAIETTYQRIDLLNIHVQPEMRNTLRAYLDERITTYHSMQEFKGFIAELNRFEEIKKLFWNQTINAIKTTNDHSVTLLFIPALNNMFDIANTRILLTKMHPPAVIFILLFGLGMLSSFLTGYNMAKHKRYSGLYAFCFVGIIAFTLYVITDLEFPRFGMIRIDAFDSLLVELREEIQYP